GTDTLFGARLVRADGGDGNDTLFATVAAAGRYTFDLMTRDAQTVLAGGAGDDRYVFTGGDLGDVRIEEASLGTADTSRDLADFSALPAAITVDLQTTTKQAAGGQNLFLTLSDTEGIEDAVGTPYSDKIFGNDRPNDVSGAALADDAAPAAT